MLGIGVAHIAIVETARRAVSTIARAHPHMRRHDLRPSTQILLYFLPLKAQRANLSKEARNMTVPEFDITPASVTSALHAA